jgi:hypothetical protein
MFMKMRFYNPLNNANFKELIVFLPNSLRYVYSVESCKHVFYVIYSNDNDKKSKKFIKYVSVWWN